MRRVLRDRFNRALRPGRERFATPPRSESSVTDVELLELLSRARVERAADADKVRAMYAVHCVAHPGSPTFDALIEDGWFGVTWGRVTTELDTRMLAQQQAEPLRTGLQIVLNARYHDATISFDAIDDLPIAAQQLKTLLTQHHENVRAASPGWIAARLWERRSRDDADSLRRWVERWKLLGTPIDAPSTWWAPTDAGAWRRAAVDVLREDPGLVPWIREKQLLDARLNHEPRLGPLPPIPSTLVERYVWLSGHQLDHWGRALESCGDTWALIDLLCADLVAHGGALEGPSATELFEVIIDHPTLLVLLATRVQRQPELLAELLLHPPTSSLACLMVADWTVHSVEAWDWSLKGAEHAEGRERAFADGVAVAVMHVRAENAPVAELAELLVWMHRQARVDQHAATQRVGKTSERMFDVLRSELQTLPKPQLEQLLAVLAFRESDGLGTARFTAAVDLISFASLTEAVDSDAMTAAYVGALRQDTFFYPVALTPAQAATLVLAAKRSKSWETFLSPLDVRERVASSKDADNGYTSRDALARALRAHVRVLSRAISAWDGVAPDDLIGALASAIRDGSSDHLEKGRVGAFAARYETELVEWRAEPPLIDDIAAACRVLSEVSRDIIASALMHVDEPLALARLLRSLPTVMKERVKGRVDALTPEDAASVGSLTEMQGRIEELLDAGATGAAAQYMAIERDLETWGPVAGREVVRLRWELRVALHERDFARIARATVPDGLNPSESQSARDAIDFHVGLAELSNPSGSASTAESAFAKLAQRHPENASYVINLFAARVSKLLGEETFGRLSGVDLASAREALNAADSALARALGVDDDSRTIHEANKALLLLAMGQAAQAHQLLQLGKANVEKDTTAAYTAVALARLGRVDEAHARLAASDAVHPNSVVLNAARQHLEFGRAVRLRVLSVAKDDNVAAIQSALFQLAQMDPITQARVAYRPTLDAHLTEEIRSAAAGVTASVPMLRGVKLQEDDVTSFLLRILDARVRFFGWSVPDQSKGGYSAKGNPGERDLVLRKDGCVIAVIEAVVCGSNPAAAAMNAKLTSHFQKLFGYDQCRVFFHLVYSYFKRPQEVVDAMRSIAKGSAPAAFTFARTDDLASEDSRPVGLVATFNAQSGGEVKVVCLVMDMLQQAQRDAAALAGKTRTSKPRARRSEATPKPPGT
jgi:tetratricopeptide (TPR) repeat protein